MLSTKNQRDELFWALMELKERLWLVWAVSDRQNEPERATTLKLVDQALDLVQHQESPNMGELRTLLNQVAATAPPGSVDTEVETLMRLIRAYESQQQGSGDSETQGQV